MELQPIETWTHALEPALAVHGQQARERALLETEAAARDTLAARAEPLAEVRDRSWPEGDVHVGIELEEALALCLGVAPAHGDHLLRIALLERPRLGEVCGEALIRLLADRAGVEDEDVRALLLGALTQAELFEHALDPLGIVGVHLTSERGDVVALHCANTVSGRFAAL